MKVLQVIDSLAVGGAEVLAVNIANMLTDEGVDSFLCVTRSEGELIKTINKDVKYLFLNKKSTLDISAIFRLKKYIKSNNIKIVHAHSSSYFIVCLIKVLYPKFKIIWHDHYGKSNFLSSRKKFPLNFLSIFFTLVISVNENLQKWAQKKLLIKKESVKYINNFASFNNNHTSTILRGEEGKRIICVAGFRPQKDHFNLLKAFLKIKKNNSDWTLHLIGKQYDDNYSREIINFINDNSLKENVFLYGVCLDVKNLLSQAVVGVLSSKSEGLPISLLEYGLAKLPVLVTDVGDCKKVINHSEALVKPENHNLFAEKLDKLIKDKILQKEISEQLYFKVKENFSKSAFTKKIIYLYNSI